MNQLAHQTVRRIAAGLRPRTAASYLATFKLFLAFVVYMDIAVSYLTKTIVVYLEFLAQNNLKCCSLRNHVSVLKHCFGLFDWPVSAFASTRVSLMLDVINVRQVVIILSEFM